MKPPVFTYERPETLPETLGALAGMQESEVKVLAGGQSLVPLMNFRLAAPGHLVDVTRVSEIAGIERTPTGLRIGAAVRHAELLGSAVVRDAAPLLGAAAAHIGHPQIRTMGTLGGSLAHADPAAELPGAVLALDGRIVVRSVRGERVIPAADFFLGHFTTALEPDELLVAVEVPVAPVRSGHAFVEVAARHGDFALAGAAALVALGPDGTVSAVRIVATAVAQTPVRLPVAEAMVLGREFASRPWTGLASAVADTLRPTAEFKASSGYKRRAAGVLVERAVSQAWRVASGDRVPAAGAVASGTGLEA